MPMYELEIIAFDIESCKVIEQCGGSRIELCANPREGGTTPSLGMIKQARAASSIQLFPIIRPRGGDFLYSTEEIESMITDIEWCKSVGCDGVVIGVLNTNGDVDMEACARLVEAAGTLQVTFHRAFDRVRDPFKSLEDIIALGCRRILTSGLHPTAMEGASMIGKLIDSAANRITIMAGSGVRSDNVQSMAKTTRATAFHSSARIEIGSKMNFKNTDMKEELRLTTVDSTEIKRLKHKLDEYFKFK